MVSVLCNLDSYYHALVSLSSIILNLSFIYFLTFVPPCGNLVS
nr:MAG TPA: hypothetical protein [Caudoviricetes sp.]